MGDGIPNGPANIMPVSLVVDDSPMDGSIIPILHLQVGVPNDPPSSVPNPVEFIEDSLQDDRMNGSVMPNLTETHEMNLHQALLPPKVFFGFERCFGNATAAHPCPFSSTLAGWSWGICSGWGAAEHNRTIQQHHVRPN